jgi:hypothetical protein
MTNNVEGKQFVFVDIEVFPDYFLLVAKDFSKDKTLVIELYEGVFKKKVDKFISFVDKFFMKFVKLKVDIPNESIYKYDDIFKELYICGFNIYDYDVPMILFMYYMIKEKGLEYALSNMNNINNMLIEGNKYIDLLGLPSYYKYKDKHKDLEKLVKKVFFDVDVINILDIYKVNGWDNDARRASLKWLEATTNADVVLESPVSFSEPLLPKGREIIEQVINYCIHDVDMTYRIFEKTFGVIENRLQIMDMTLDKHVEKGIISGYKLKNINKVLKCNSTQFGAFILIEKMTNLDKKEIDKIRENRKKIYSGEVEMFVLGEIIKDNIKLKNIEDMVKIKNTKVYVNTNRNGHSDIEDTNKYELTYIINKT